MLELKELLAELVRHPSPSGNEAELADRCIGWLSEEGIDAQRVGDSVLARVRHGSGPSLLLNTHLDTVPIGEGWTVDPLAALWEQGRLYGRGSNDAKASVAAMMEALCAWHRDPRGEGEVWLALNAQEETTNRGMTEVLAVTGRPDGAVTGEPTGLEVVRAQAGLCIIDATWVGRSCHAAHVSRVDHDNAMLRAAAEVTSTGPYLQLEGEHPLIGVSTIAPTVFQSGDRHNRVPDSARAVFDGRLAPPHDAEACLAALRELLPSAKLDVRSARLGPVETPSDHPFVQAALDAAGRSEAIGSNTLSDMALLPGIPAIKCGPGQTARSHTPDEFILEGELVEGARFYTKLIPAALEALATQDVNR